MNISKSSYLSGIRCPKLLWHRVNEPHTILSLSAASQTRMEQGRQIGILAKGLFPGGVDVPWDSPFATKREKTQSALRERVPIYEASFSAQDAHAQIDILVPTRGGLWNIHEVKASTGVKEEHLPDVGFQLHVCESAGIKIRRCLVVTIDGDYVRKGAIDVNQLFFKHDVTTEAKSVAAEIPENLTEFRSTLADHSAPDIRIGTHCTSPYECALQATCWAFLPEQNVTELYRGKQVPWDLLGKGIQSLEMIPPNCELNPNQEIQVNAARSGKPHVDREAIRTFLGSLRYPIWFLDFETINPAIPLFEGTSPYQQIPFQFSLHVVREPGGEADHVGWLAEGKADPRLGFLEALQRALGERGDIVVYYAAFEKGRLAELADDYPEHKVWIENALNRLVDLYVPFRDFSYYHPEQHGSASLKAVVPSLTGNNSYDKLAIADGGTASQEFLRVEFGDADDDERMTIRKRLKKYCATDTLAMKWILGAFERLVY